MINDTFSLLNITSQIVYACRGNRKCHISTRITRSCAAQVSSYELNENATSVSLCLHKDNNASLYIKKWFTIAFPFLYQIGHMFDIEVCIYFSAAVHMNNLNDPQDWNIRPERQGDGGGSSKWNYALLVPMLGLAAFRKYYNTLLPFTIMYVLINCT